MTEFLAWHLPGHPVAAGNPLLQAEAGCILAPALTPADLVRIVASLTAAGEALRALSNDDVIHAIDAVARRFLDPADPLRQAALHWLPAATGYGDRMCALVLERMAADWTAPSLQRLLRAELRDPRALERFVRHAPGQQVRAVPPRLAFHVLAGNVPGVGVTSLVRGLLARAPALCKTALAEPVLPVLFARALLDRHPALGEALAVAYWTGGDAALEQPALDACDTVIHYGSDQAIADLRRRTPAGVRVLEHGPRISFAIVAREHVVRPATAAAAARAVATFDQQGCVSPHLIYVEDGGRTGPRAFAENVARELASLAAELPRGRLSLEEAAAVQHLRATTEFRALAGEDLGLWTGPDLAWTVVFDPDPAFTASCLNRSVLVKPLPSIDLAAQHILPFARLLQTVAIAAPSRRSAPLADALALAGCTRITTLEHMPFPTPSWHHDGRGPLRELLRWADRDSPSK